MDKENSDALTRSAKKNRIARQPIKNPERKNHLQESLKLKISPEKIPLKPQIFPWAIIRIDAERPIKRPPAIEYILEKSMGGTMSPQKSNVKIF